MRWIVVPLSCAGCVGGLLATNTDRTRGASAADAAGEEVTGDTGPLVAPEATVEWSLDAALVTRVELDVALTGAAAALLDCVAEADPEERHLATVVDGANVLSGLLAGTGYTCALTVGQVALWEGEVRTLPLPAGLPELVLGATGDGDLARGYVVTHHWDRATGLHHALVLDGDGRIRWYRALEDPTEGDVAVTLVGDHLLAGGGRGLAPAWFTLDGVRGFQVSPPPDGEVDHHEAMRTPEGHLLRLRTAPLPHPSAEGFAIEVTDPATGAVVWSYDSADGLLAGDFPDVDEKRRDPFGADAVVWVDDALGPAVWVSLRATSELVRIDRETGRVTTRLGPGRGFALVDPSGAPLPDDEWFYGQHAPQLVGDRLLLLDNGDGRPGALRSRAVEYRVDLVSEVVTRAWAWSEDGWFERRSGSVALRPSGHVLVASGHDAEDPDSGGGSRTAFVLELEPTTGEVVRRLDLASPSGSLYRAQLVPGCASFANVRYCPRLSDDAG